MISLLQELLLYIDVQHSLLKELNAISEDGDEKYNEICSKACCVIIELLKYESNHMLIKSEDVERSDSFSISCNNSEIFEDSNDAETPIQNYISIKQEINDQKDLNNDNIFLSFPEFMGLHGEESTTYNGDTSDYDLLKYQDSKSCHAMQTYVSVPCTQKDKNKNALHYKKVHLKTPYYSTRRTLGKSKVPDYSKIRFTPKDETFQCPTCLKSFTSFSRFQVHSKQHLVKRRKIRGNQVHFKKHLVKEKRIYGNEIYSKDLKNPIVIGHFLPSLGLSNVPKSDLKFNVSKPKQLQATIPASRHASGISKHNCNFCGKTFTWYSDLKDHYKTHVSFNPFHCKTCLKSFPTFPEFQSHVLEHSDDKS